MSVVLEIPTTLLEQAAYHAENGHSSLEQFIILAIAEKVARTENDEWLLETAQVQTT